MDAFDGIGFLFHPEILIPAILILVIGSVGFYFGKQANPEGQVYRQLQREISKCEANLPRNMQCNVDLSQLVITTGEIPQSRIGKAIQFLTEK